MSRLLSILVPAATALVGGVIGGLVVSLVQPAPKKAKAVTVAAEHEPQRDTRALEDRVAALEQHVAAQRLRALQLSGRSPADSNDPGGSSSKPNDAPPVIDDPVFEAAVRDIMERVNEERASERELRSEERRREAAENWANELSRAIGLREDQKAKVITVVQDYLQSLRQGRGPDAGPLTREERRARMRELRDDAERRLGEFLTRDQLDAYRKLDDEQRIGGMFRRGRRERD